MLALLVLAVVVGLSNFAAAIGIGVSGVSGGTRLRIAAVFGLFEGGMPVLGLVLGHDVASSLGHAARWIGGAVLIAVGVSSLVQASRGRPAHFPGAAGTREAPVPGQAAAGGGPAAGGPGEGAGPGGGRPWRTGRITASALALSMDNLAIGFALGPYHTGLALAATVFGAVSVAMSLAGLELGATLGAATGDRSELLACALLITVGGAMAAGAL
jgi:manganese efflux pump family protein